MRSANLNHDLHASLMSIAILGSVVRRTHLLNSLHQIMLVLFAQLLNAVNNLLILLALHGDRDGDPAHDERSADMAVLCDGL